ncbi:tRNA-queuosine alpha-mannosyltransferase-like isoform X2 [Porites lutea]|uniref:tRNA-queuosine alpha-mannosyltransferase-like isoform X2 n=1 Tax=Porites lutea TaxID=51062 RepID=UPI003CC5F990
MSCNRNCVNKKLCSDSNSVDQRLHLDNGLFLNELPQESVNDLNVNTSVLLIEPFYGGSHKQLVDLLTKEIPGCVLHCLPAKKWHWRMRTAALWFSQNIPHCMKYKVMFVSSVLNLAELVALRPDFAQLKKVLYFHENQLIYPVRKQQDRDFQYGYNQILSCLVADVVVFNSSFNMESFLSSISSFLKLMPDFRPKGLDQLIRPKCKVLYFPLMGGEQMGGSSSAEQEIVHEVPAGEINEENLLVDTNGEKIVKLNRNSPHPETESDMSRPLHIVWAHRWEHDKGPDLFFHTLYQLADQNLEFKVSVIGETFSEVPEIFEEAFSCIREHIVHWGYQQSCQEYVNVLKNADVAVSTAEHEFFGVSMLESVQYGCYPLCPNKLVYPEIFPEGYLCKGCNLPYF